MSSEDEDILAAVNLINVLNHNQRSTKRKYWVHPFWRKNCNNRGVYSVFKELNDPDMFRSFYRMEKSTFEELVRLVGSSIKKKTQILEDQYALKNAFLLSSGKLNKLIKFYFYTISMQN